MASATSLPMLATSVQVLKELGEQMGLKGTELRDFIKEQQDVEKEKRTKQRESETKQREYEKENAKLAAEEQEKQRAFEREKLEFEQGNQKIEAEKSKVEADKLVFLKKKQEQELQIEKDRQAHELLKLKAQQDHELALEKQKVEYDASAEAKKQAHELRVLKEKQDYERMQIEQKKLEQEMADTLKHRSRHAASENEGWMEFGVKPKPFKGPKMPCFEESKDNMDAFLHRFEIYAETQCWRRDQWAVYLSALLKGKALEVYSRLPVKDAQDYEALEEIQFDRRRF